MTSFDPPEDPRLNDRWHDEAGELRIWDGERWVPFDDPFFGLTSTIRED